MYFFVFMMSLELFQNRTTCDNPYSHSSETHFQDASLKNHFNYSYESLYNSYNHTQIISYKDNPEYLELVCRGNLILWSFFYFVLNPANNSVSFKPSPAPT